ncbi:Ig-like domain repeat protein [Streptomyces spinoverrucosus]|uniref:Ig-like domain repeat protein n=1 Tax=Streptomyces spinoverrucosus TaxID=284043 RepID=UPI0018C3CEF8|nr:Ig-like domain repeat protein [Streptomyces spinoverrucosus]MBG0852925.1 Ig-like domain repeat protein [Streptomyces spinoverrucosus]
MNQRLAHLRSPVALLTCCALLCAALAGIVAFSGRANAATDLGKFTLSPSSGNILTNPLAESVTTSGGCPDPADPAAPHSLNLKVVNPQNTAVQTSFARGVEKAPIGTAPFTVNLQPHIGAFRKPLGEVLRGWTPEGSLDGVYTLLLACGGGTEAPVFQARIRVTGDTWTLLQQQATNVSLTAATGVPVKGDLKLTATVQPQAAAGSVEFKTGGTSLGKADVTDGKAELTVKAPAVGGPHQYEAVFTPDDPDAYGESRGTAPANIGYLLTAKDAEGNALGDNPTLSIGKTVKITVQGFTPGSTVKVSQSPASGATFQDATPNAEGTIVDYAFTVPDRTISGETSLYFDEGGSANKRASFDFTSTDEEDPDPTDPADLEVTDEDGNTLDENPSLEPGQTVKITARGYTEDATVTVTLAESEETFQDATANAEGTVEEYEFTVPEDIADGDHVLTLAEDKTDGHSVDFAFTTGEEPTESPSPSESETSGDDAGTGNGGTDSGGTDSGGAAGGDTGGTGTGGGSMASTGAQVGAIGLTALALLCAGAALVIHMRRKGLLAFDGDTPQHH